MNTNHAADHLYETLKAMHPCYQQIDERTMDAVVVFMDEYSNNLRYNELMERLKKNQAEVTVNGMKFTFPRVTADCCENITRRKDRAYELKKSWQETYERSIGANMDAIVKTSMAFQQAFDEPDSVRKQLKEEVDTANDRQRNTALVSLVIEEYLNQCKDEHDRVPRKPITEFQYSHNFDEI